MKSRVSEIKKQEKGDKRDWDQSTTASRKDKTVEDKVAAQIAREMLENNQKLRGVHSNVSIKKIIEKEAKRQLLKETGGVFKPPMINTVVEKGSLNKMDASNLPYLHKCPAV